MNFEKLKKLMDKFISEYNTPGVDCIVYKDHEILYRNFTGVNDIEKKKMSGQELFIAFS